jgi:hypothetical protein
MLPSITRPGMLAGREHGTQRGNYSVASAGGTSISSGGIQQTWPSFQTAIG